MRAARLGAAIVGTLVLLAAPVPAGADGSGGRVANAQAAKWYQEGSPALFVDLRTVTEHAQSGRLARALWVPLGANGRGTARLVSEVLGAVDGDRTRTIVLVCQAGVKAVAAAEALRARGFRSVLAVEGGLWAGEPWLAFELE